MRSYTISAYPSATKPSIHLLQNPPAWAHIHWFQDLGEVDPTPLQYQLLVALCKKIENEKENKRLHEKQEEESGWKGEKVRARGVRY